VSQASRNTVPIWLHEGLAKFLESRWRGAAGQSMSPSTLALLGSRVKKNQLIPFEKMHPSIALLPTAEDAATAFAEVFFAIDFIHREHGAAGLRAIIAALAAGKTDKEAVEAVTQKSFAAFEKAWLTYVKRQPFPQGLIPRSSDEKKVLREDVPQREGEAPKGKEISFAEFSEVAEAEARRFAHLGELLRERNRPAAAAEEYGKAHQRVGSRYESVSNKYALALLELGRLEEAKKVLEGSLEVHPRSASTQVHLGRIYLRRKEWAKAGDAYQGALATNPFDPEIHLALVRVHEALGAQPLLARAQKAAMVLTGLKPEEVLRVARALGGEGENLGEMDIPPAPAGTPP
jgi:tetratricopeptide (TPR) repeat protein